MFLRWKHAQPRARNGGLAQCSVLSVGETCTWSVHLKSARHALCRPLPTYSGTIITSPFSLQLPSSGCSISLPMGRPPWATPEQTKYLESFLPNLDREKEGNGLTAHYDYISSEFLKSGQPNLPMRTKRTPAIYGSLSNLQKLVEKK